MGNKTSEAINICVDELALSLVGWQVEDAQARLVTKPGYANDYEQQVAFSGSFRFLPEDWTDRFKDSDGSDYASEVFLTLNRRDTPAPSSDYKWIVLEKIRKAKKGLIRVSAKSDTWSCRVPLTTKEIDLRLTAHDLDDVRNLFINSDLMLPSPTTPLEITVVDETSVDAPHPKVAVANAFLSKGDYRTTLTVHTEGSFEFGSAEDLLKTYLGRLDWENDGSTVKDFAPFEVDVPEITFEILDDSGFLLDDRPCTFYGHIPVDAQGATPRRQPRWIGRSVIDIADLPGDPHRVVVRVIDGEE
ncbi:hypothetical protein [Tomitella cavernea]|uniref:Uncharacterized protein n=1 Tax=Tomitella cavernea TaxID=1387982 RepID=A0ABP9D1D6_9ACTN|nr:hypothetical protein [Tomitella cavernea]